MVEREDPKLSPRERAIDIIEIESVFQFLELTESVKEELLDAVAEVKFKPGACLLHQEG